MSLLLVLQVLRQRIWIVILAFLAVMAGAILALIFVPARYDAVATASIDPSISDPISGTTAGVQIMGIVQGNLVALAKSNQVALSVVKRLNMDANPSIQAQYIAAKESELIDIKQYLASQLLDHLDAKFVLGSNVLNIIYKGSDPRQAALFANAFMSSFNDAAITMKVDEAQKAASWFTPQIDNVRSDLEASRLKLTKFQADAQLLQPMTADAENDQLIAVNNDLTKTRAELVALKNQLAAPAQTGAASNEAQSVDLQTLVSLRSNLSGVDAEIAKLQNEVGANNPKLREKYSVKQSLKKQLDDQVQEFRKKLNDRIASATEKVATLEKARAEKLNFMVGIQAQRDKLAGLERDVHFYQDELDRLQRAASQARLQSRLSFSNIGVIDAAAPPTAVSFPKPLLVLAMAMLSGLGLGILLAMLAETFDRRMRSSADLQYTVDAPLLGSMINIHPKKPTLLSRLRWRLRLGLSQPRLPAKT